MLTNEKAARLQPKAATTITLVAYQNASPHVKLVHRILLNPKSAPASYLHQAADVLLVLNYPMDAMERPVCWGLLDRRLRRAYARAC